MRNPKICTFYGMREIVDVNFANKAREAITRLVEENESVEFWFHITGTSYEVFLMETLAARTRYPDKNISLVFVSEINPQTGSEENPLGTYFYKRYMKSVPLSFFDKVIFAPEYRGKSEKTRKDFIRIYQHTQSWLIEQCDVLIAYEYPELFSSEATYLKRFSKKVDDVILLTSEETSQRIVSYIAELEDKERGLMEELLSGKKVAEIARERKVSQTAIDGKVDRITRIIKERIRRDYRTQLKNEDRNPNTKCAVCGLNGNSKQYIYDIVVLINYMKKELGIMEYYIPYNLCFNEIIGPLISMSKEAYNGISLVAVVPENDTKDTTYYCPPYSRILSITNLVENDFYKNLISECGYVICDLSAVENKFALKEFCSSVDTTLIDVSLLSGQLSKNYCEEEKEC